MGKWRKIWRSSEAIAAQLLEDLGYNIIEIHKKIIAEGVEIGEIDIIAEKNSEIYAIEVKAGSVDLSGVRQAYVNAKLLNAKPLVIARGIDEKARNLAEKLGVEVILLPDLILTSPDDLREIVFEAVMYAIEEITSVITKCQTLTDKEKEIIEAIAFTNNIREASERLGKNLKETAREISQLTSKGILPRGSYRLIKLASRLLITCQIFKHNE